MKRILSVLGLSLAPVICVVAAEAPALEGSKVREELNEMQGKPAPAISLDQWLNSVALNLTDLKGKIVVLDFWATWCGPCLKAVPHNNELSKKYADKGVVIIGVCIKRGAETMAQTAKKYGIAYPIAADSSGETETAYKANSYPDYYIIDRAGKLRWADIVNADVEKAIELLLAEST